MTDNHQNTPSTSKPHYLVFPDSLLPLNEILSLPDETVDEKLRTFVTEIYPDNAQQALLTIVTLASLARVQKNDAFVSDYAPHTSERLQNALTAANEIRSFMVKTILHGIPVPLEYIRYRRNISAIEDVVSSISPGIPELLDEVIEARLLIPSAVQVYNAFEYRLFQLTWDDETKAIRAANGELPTDLMTLAQDDGIVLAAVDGIMYLTSHGFGNHAYHTSFNRYSPADMMTSYQLALAIVKTRVIVNANKNKHVPQPQTAQRYAEVVTQFQNGQPEKPLDLYEFIFLLGGHIRDEELV